MKISINVDLKTNRVVRNFILVDLALLAGWGLIEPILALYVVGNVAGATVVTVGTAAGIYWIFKSMLQIPIAKYLDRTPGEEDDLRFLIAGLLLAAFSAFSFSLITKIWQLYAVQLIHAVAFGLYGATWPAIFSRHLDKDKVSFDWALDSTAVGISAGVSGVFGGLIASWLGFKAVFVLAALFTLLSAFVLILSPNLVMPEKKSNSETSFKDHTPANIGR